MKDFLVRYASPVTPNASPYNCVHLISYLCPLFVKKYNLISLAINTLYELEKPLMVYQVIESIETKKIRRIADMIENEQALLNGLLPEDRKHSHKSFLVLNWDYIKKAEFMSNMVNLHRYTYSKVIRAQRIK